MSEWESNATPDNVHLLLSVQPWAPTTRNFNREQTQGRLTQLEETISELLPENHSLAQFQPCSMTRLQDSSNPPCQLLFEAIAG